MEKIVSVIGTAVLVVLLMGIAAFISGTILFLIWPVAIPAVFPGLVASGVIAARLSWWVSVCIVWVFSILIKAPQTNNNK